MVPSQKLEVFQNQHEDLTFEKFAEREGTGKETETMPVGVEGREKKREREAQRPGSSQSRG